MFHETCLASCCSAYGCAIYELKCPVCKQTAPAETVQDSEPENIRAAGSGIPRDSAGRPLAEPTEEVEPGDGFRSESDSQDNDKEAEEEETPEVGVTHDEVTDDEGPIEAAPKAKAKSKSTARAMAAASGQVVAPKAKAAAKAKASTATDTGDDNGPPATAKAKAKAKASPATATGDDNGPPVTAKAKAKAKAAGVGSVDGSAATPKTKAKAKSKAKAAPRDEGDAEEPRGGGDPVEPTSLTTLVPTPPPEAQEVGDGSTSSLSWPMTTR